MNFDEGAAILAAAQEAAILADAEAQGFPPIQGHLRCLLVGPMAVASLGGQICHALKSAHHVCFRFGSEPPRDGAGGAYLPGRTADATSLDAAMKMSDPTCIVWCGGARS